MYILSWLFGKSNPRQKTSFQVKYLGWERVSTYGAHECFHTTATIYALKERQIRDIPLTTLQLSVEGLTELELNEKNVGTFDFKQIVFSAVDCLLSSFSTAHSVEMVWTAMCSSATPNVMLKNWLWAWKQYSRKLS